MEDLSFSIAAVRTDNKVSDELALLVLEQADLEKVGGGMSDQGDTYQ